MENEIVDFVARRHDEQDPRGEDPQRVRQVHQAGRALLPGPAEAAMNSANGRKRPLYCTCRGEHPGPVNECPVHGGTYEINITTANKLITEWGLIAKSIAQQCKWRPRGMCLQDCMGLAVCNLDGLTLVDHSGAGVSPALL